MTYRHHFHPKMETFRGLLQIARKSRGAGDDVEQNIPLGAQNHKRTEPDIGVETKMDDQDHGSREKDVGRKGREELRDRLDFFRDAKAASRSRRQ